MGLYLVAIFLCICSASTWNCNVVNKTNAGKGISYVSWNCTGSPGEGEGDWKVGPTLFHAVYGDLSLVMARVVTADPKAQLQTLPEMLPSSALAAVNAGFFFEINRGHFIDNVCFFKSRADALKNASSQSPNDGLSDTQLTRDGQVLGSNCHLAGFPVPAALVLNASSSQVVLPGWGKQLDPKQYPNVVTCGPRLVQWNAEAKKPQYGVPFDDWGLNRWEHSSNTAIGLLGSQPGNVTHMVLVASDGHDGCPRSDPTCGIESEPMAYFMMDFLHTIEAVQMDQGGSTTLFVAGQGVVNNNRDHLRPVFSGLMFLPRQK